MLETAHPRRRNLIGADFLTRCQVRQVPPSPTKSHQVRQVHPSPPSPSQITNSRPSPPRPSMSTNAMQISRVPSSPPSPPNVPRSPPGLKSARPVQSFNGHEDRPCPQASLPSKSAKSLPDHQVLPSMPADATQVRQAPSSPPNPPSLSKFFQVRQCWQVCQDDDAGNNAGCMKKMRMMTMWSW